MKTILFFTLPHIDEDEYNTFVTTVFEAVSRFKNIKLIIKVHPNETDCSIYKKKIKEYSLKDTELITKTCDIFELGRKADVIISGFSTTVMDMAVINKPVVMLHINDNNEYAQDYHDKGGCVMVKDSYHLYMQIKNIFEDKLYVRFLEIRKEQFISEYMYKLDGKASKRIVNVIEREMKKAS